MSDLVVITFTTQDAGLAALKHIRDVEHASGLTLSDTAVVEKDADGKVHVKNEVSSGTEVGAVFLGSSPAEPIRTTWSSWASSSASAPRSAGSSSAMSTRIGSAAASLM